MRPAAFWWFLLASVVDWNSLSSTATAARPCGISPSQLRRRRIINGDELSPHQFPWLVSLQSNGTHFCGGMLVSVDYVLTAAHCSTVGSNRDLVVVVGAHDLSSGGIRVNGTMLLHPNYSEGSTFSLDYDIALVKLTPPVSFSPTVQPICLPAADDDVRDGALVITAGWGIEFTWWDIFNPRIQNTSNQSRIDEFSRRLKNFTDVANSTLPKRSILFIESYSQCFRDMGAYDNALKDGCSQLKFDDVWCDVWNRSLFSDYLLPNPNRSLLCGVSRSSGQQQRVSSICRGDSGGPLMKQASDGAWSLLGVASATAFDCLVRLEGFPQVGGFFADVRLSLSWITETLARRDLDNSCNSPLRARDLSDLSDICSSSATEASTMVVVLCSLLGALLFQ